ncbi:MAG: arginase [Thermaurantimonas sp.]
MAKRKIRLISIMSELGAGTRGASLGLDAMRIASFKLNPKFFKKYKVEEVKHLNNMLFEEDNTPYAKRLDGIVTVYQRIEEKLVEILENGYFPIVISGDHSNAGGTIAGIKSAFPDKRLGVIWIDAHADLHSPYTSPSGNVHGMPLATALSEDNLDCKLKKVPESTLQYWNQLKGKSPRIQYSDLVFIALRSTEMPEDYLILRNKIPVIKVSEVREKGPVRAAEKALQYLADCDIIYISFDVDSMDPSVSRGTGTPVPGGLYEEEATAIINRLLEDPRVVCLEFTEINPVLDDKGNAMGEAAFRILSTIVETIKLNN